MKNWQENSIRAEREQQGAIQDELLQAQTYLAQNNIDTTGMSNEQILSEAQKIWNQNNPELMDSDIDFEEIPDEFFNQGIKEITDIADENARLDDIYPEYTGETIEVDGKERTVYNSTGERIAKSAEALRNFYKWFGDSKVVDEQGRPLVVYHGTSSEFTEFDITQSGKNTGTAIYGKGFYFTTNKDVATKWGAKHGEPIVMSLYIKLENPNIVKELEYPKDSQEKGFDGVIAKVWGTKDLEIVVFDNYQTKFNQTTQALNKIVNGAEESTVKNLRNDLSQYGGTNDVMFVFGDKKKGIAHIVDSHGVDVLPQVIDTVIDGKIQRHVAGNKTVILEKNGYEAVLSLDEHGNTKTWLLSGWKVKESTGETGKVSAKSSPTQDRPTFSRSELGAVLNTMSMTQPYKNVNNQIKSVDNRGTYSADTGNIYRQKTIGAWNPLRKTIELGTGANETTLPHELSHFWLDNMMMYSRLASAAQNEGFARVWNNIKRYLDIDDRQDVVNVAQAEKYTSAYMQYIRNNKTAPKGGIVNSGST